MHFTYILYSGSLDSYYIGSSENPELRLIKHLQKHRGYTAKAKDWKLVYTEVFELKTQAIKREYQIKKWKSRAMLERLILGH